MYAVLPRKTSRLPVPDEVVVKGVCQFIGAVIIIISLLYTALPCFAGEIEVAEEVEYETMIVFIPDASREKLLSLVPAEIIDAISKGEPHTDMNIAYDNINNKYIYNINKITKQGWEIKATRSGWVDMDGDKYTDTDFEMGIEYTLQHKIVKKKQTIQIWPIPK